MIFTLKRNFRKLDLSFLFFECDIRSVLYSIHRLGFPKASLLSTKIKINNNNNNVSTTIDHKL